MKKKSYLESTWYIIVVQTYLFFTQIIDSMRDMITWSCRILFHRIDCLRTVLNFMYLHKLCFREYAVRMPHRVCPNHTLRKYDFGNDPLLSNILICFLHCSLILCVIWGFDLSINHVIDGVQNIIIWLQEDQI